MPAAANRPLAGTPSLVEVGADVVDAAAEDGDGLETSRAEVHVIDAVDGPYTAWNVVDAVLESGEHRSDHMPGLRAVGEQLEDGAAPGVCDGRRAGRGVGHPELEGALGQLPLG